MVFISYGKPILPMVNISVSFTIQASYLQRYTVENILLQTFHLHLQCWEHTPEKGKP